MRKGSICMRRKWISTLLMLTIGVGLLSGCGKAADNNTTTEVTDATSNGEDGTVTLRVWSEESNFDLLFNWKSLNYFNFSFSQLHFQRVLHHLLSGLPVPAYPMETHE